MSKDSLFHLVHSLSKAEKRNFKLFVKRLKNSEQSNFVRLFDVMDQARSYDEKQIFEKIPELKKAQLSNTKAHLYKQLLLSLRLNTLNQNLDIQLREQIDYARVLYNKGLYRQSLRILEKAKALAKRLQLDLISLEIVEFEKRIELQYITHSHDKRAEELSRESTKLGATISRQNAFTDLALQLYGLYLKGGYVRNEEDYLRVQAFFQTHLPEYHSEEELNFNEQLGLYYAQVWYFSLVQDFLNVYKYALKWVNLFEQQPELIASRTDLFLKGYYHLLKALYLARHPKQFKRELERLEAFPENRGIALNENDRLLRDQFVWQHRLNYHLQEGSFREGVKWIGELEVFLKENNSRMDAHTQLIFSYKIACIYFGSGDFKNALHYLNLIINEKETSIRSDIHCFARILHLITHFELGNDRYVEHAIKSTYRFLIKMEDMNAVQQEIFRFLRKLGEIFPQELKEAFIQLKERLEKLASDPYERRPFTYLDIISWLESKIEERPVEAVIREKTKR